MSYQYQPKTSKVAYDQYGNPIGVQPQSYYNTTNDQGMNYPQAVPVAPIKPHEQVGTGWKDLPFAILFMVNVIGMIALMGIWGFSAINKNPSKNNDSSLDSTDIRKILLTCGAVCVFAAVVSLLLLQLIVRYAKCAITFCLWFSVALAFIFAFVCFLINIFMGIIGLVFAGLMLYYAIHVRNRIPFAAANLQVAAAAVKAHRSTYCVAFIILILQFIWVFIWALAFLGVQTQLSDVVNKDGKDPGLSCVADNDCMYGVCENRFCNEETLKTSSGIVYFFMLISFYWGVIVLKNIGHVTFAGTVATWWFSIDSSGATLKSFKRSITTSLGSIALGSLIVAILKAIRSIAQDAQRQGNACACFAVCILQCIEALIEYFNKWAFVYVGIYGFKFTTAGKSVFQLFKDRGFSAIINDDLIDNVLGLVSFVVGLICAGLVVGFCVIFDDYYSFPNARLILGIVSFFIGFGISMVPFSVIDSAVATIFVCFAEDPAVFAQNNYQLYNLMVSSWYELYPDVMVTSGYQH